MSGEVIRFVVASGASALTTFTRVYVAALLLVAGGAATLFAIGGGFPGGPNLFLSSAVVFGGIAAFVALPLLVIVAVLFVVFGGLK